MEFALIFLPRMENDLEELAVEFEVDMIEKGSDKKDGYRGMKGIDNEKGRCWSDHSAPSTFHRQPDRFCIRDTKTMPLRFWNNRPLDIERSIVQIALIHRFLLFHTSYQRIALSYSIIQHALGVWSRLIQTAKRGKDSASPTLTEQNVSSLLT